MIPKERFMKRRYAVGAELLGKDVHFRVWAPKCTRVEVVLETRAAPLEAEGNGYFSGAVADVAAGARYRYRLDEAAQRILRSLLQDRPATRVNIPRRAAAAAKAVASAARLAGREVRPRVSAQRAVRPSLQPRSPISAETRGWRPGQTAAYRSGGLPQVRRADRF